MWWMRIIVAPASGPPTRPSFARNSSMILVLKSLASPGAEFAMISSNVSMVSRHLAVVLVVATPPEAGLVAAEWRAVEPLVHAPEAVHAPLVRGVRVVDDAILEHERAHAGSLSPVRRPVRSDNARRELVEARAVLTRGRPKVRRAEVVLGGARLPLLLGQGSLEVVVEV